MEANLLRSTRVALGLTQVQLARRAGVSQPVISDLERGGAVGKRAAASLFRALKGRVPLEWLLGIDRSNSAR